MQNGDNQIHKKIQKYPSTHSHRPIRRQEKKYLKFFITFETIWTLAAFPKSFYKTLE